MKKLFAHAACAVALCLAACVTGCGEDAPTQPTPDPNDNALPGVAYMGHGYNVFGEYAKAAYVKSPLFRYAGYRTMTVHGTSYTIPDEMEYTSVNTSDFRSVSGVNAVEYRSEMSLNASLSGSYSFFSMSVTNNYKVAQYRSRYRAFCTIRNLVRKWKLTLPYTDAPRLRGMLTDEAKSDLATLAPTALFDKYGTNVLTELMIGARADYNTCVTKSSATVSISNKFELCAEASFRKKSGKGSVQIVTEQELQTFESNSYRDLKVAGGRSEYGSYIFETGMYDKWIESIDNMEDLTICDFTEHSLLPIWDLAADEARRTQLRAAFETWARQYELPSLVDEAISALGFEVTTNPPITPQPNWSMINVDLNRDAHGKYIYLCYQNGLDEDEAIADITFITNSQSVPDGYVKMPQDLNEGAGGAFIYLCYKKMKTAQPIRRIEVLVGENTAPSPGFYYAKNAHSKVKQDLNQGAGGNYIWLAYSYVQPNPWE